MDISGKEVCRVIENNGWVFVRQNGTSHRTYKKQGVAKLVTVPMHSHVSIGVVRNIERITGLSLRRER